MSPDNVGASDIQWIVNDRVSLRGFTQGVDLAYVYVHTGGNVFWCLGRELGLDCHVELERITLADAILASLVATGCQRSHIIPQGYDALRAPWALPRL